MILYNINYENAYGKLFKYLFFLILTDNRMPRSKAVAKKSIVKDEKKKTLLSQKVNRKTAPVSTGVKKRRWKPGTVALR